MITFHGDQRVAPEMVNNINSVVNRLNANSLVQNLMSGVTASVMFTTLRPDGSGLPENSTGIGPQSILIDPVYGLGSNYDYTNVNTGYSPDSYSDILLIESRYVSGSVAVPTFSGQNQISLTRTLFHEMMHLRFEFPVGTNLIFLEEEIAVFAENIFYRSIASALNEDDAFIRYGHDGQLWNGVGVSGVASFQAYIDSPTGQVGIDDAGTNAQTVTFVAAGGLYALRKVYHSSGFEAGEYAYDHYIRLTETKSQGSYVTPTQAGQSIDGRLSVVISDMMHGDVLGAVSTAISAWKNVSQISNSAAPAFTRITGLGGDAFSDKGFRYVGPASAGSSDTRTPAWLVIDDGSETASTILVGAGGSRGDILDAGSGDDLLIAAGLVENRLHGSDGNDILVGTAGVDKLFGDAHDDILVGRAGANELNGGDGNDAAYYGDRPQGIVVYDSLGRVDHDGVLDTVTSIERYVGTKQRDIFVGSGNGHIYFGNGGNDLYLAGDGGDRFIGSGTATSRSGEASFEALTSGVEIDVASGITDSQHEFGFVSKITGSSHKDVFRGSLSASSLEIRGGSGDDDFQVGNGVTAYGEGGDDTFNMGADSQRAYGGTGSDRFFMSKITGNVLIDGGTTDGDTDVLDFSLYPGEVRLNLANSTFTGSWSTNSFSSIEKFYFGKNAVQISGSATTDVISTGSTKSILNGWEGEDFLTVTEADEHTPTNHSRSDVTVNGGNGIDHIFAHRGATLNGDAGGDFIWGSNESDLIRGGAGDDIIDARGGDDFFEEAPNGIDHIDAGDGIDTYSSFDRVGAFDFFLAGDDLEWFGIQKTGSATDQLLFKQLDKLKFFASYSADDKFDLFDALSVLQADPDHFMTGTQMKAAIAARLTAGRASADTSLWFASEEQLSDAENFYAATIPATQFEDGAAPILSPAWTSADLHMAPMHSDWILA